MAERGSTEYKTPTSTLIQTHTSIIVPISSSPKHCPLCVLRGPASRNRCLNQSAPRFESLSHLLFPAPFLSSSIFSTSFIDSLRPVSHSPLRSVLPKHLLVLPRVRFVASADRQILYGLYHKVRSQLCRFLNPGFCHEPEKIETTECVLCRTSRRTFAVD